MSSLLRQTEMAATIFLVSLFSVFAVSVVLLAGFVVGMAVALTL